MNLYNKNIRGFVDFGKQTEPKNPCMFQCMSRVIDSLGTVKILAFYMKGALPSVFTEEHKYNFNAKKISRPSLFKQLHVCNWHCGHHHKTWLVKTKLMQGLAVAHILLWMMRCSNQCTTLTETINFWAKKCFVRFENVMKGSAFRSRLEGKALTQIGRNSAKFVCDIPEFDICS